MRFDVDHANSRYRNSGVVSNGAAGRAPLAIASDQVHVKGDLLSRGRVQVAQFKIVGVRGVEQPYADAIEGQLGSGDVKVLGYD